MRVTPAVLLLSTFGCRGVHDAAAPGVFLDLDARVQSPLVVDRAAAHVLIFLLPDCPVANTYAPEICAIRRAFEPAGVRFFLVHVQPDLSVEAARAHAVAFAHDAPILIDREHELVRATGVSVTPEAAVLDRAGHLRYRGRIDDLYLDVGKKRHTATSHDLRDALAAIVAGQPVATPTTPAVGCFISDAAHGRPR